MRFPWRTFSRSYVLIVPIVTWNWYRDLLANTSRHSRTRRLVVRNIRRWQGRIRSWRLPVEVTHITILRWKISAPGRDPSWRLPFRLDGGEEVTLPRKKSPRRRIWKISRLIRENRRPLVRRTFGMGRMRYMSRRRPFARLPSSLLRTLVRTLTTIR